MKNTLKFAVPEVKIEEVTVFPGLTLDVNIEYSSEEFLALLPHVIDFQKVIGPQIAELRTQILDFLRAAGAAVTPELLAMGHQLLDFQIAQIRSSDTAETDFDKVYRAMRLSNEAELHEANMRRARSTAPVPEPEATTKTNGIFSRR